MRKTGLLLAMWVTGTAPAALAAQQAPAPQPQAEHAADDEGEIVVTGAPPRGSVVGDIPPEKVLTPADIRAYGVSTVAELLTELAPQTQSGRGRDSGGPVVLLSGRRISGFGEIRDIPAEAIERVDILPEEVALKYGYRADQRVVNIVLRRRFRSLTAEIEGQGATAGGREVGEIDLGLLRLNAEGRFSLDVKYTGSAALLESERDVISSVPRQPYDLLGNITATTSGAEIDPALSARAGTPVTVAGVPVSAATGAPGLSAFAANNANVTDTSAYRTLLPSSRQLSINSTVARTLFGHVSASANLRYEIGDTESLLGLPGISLALPAGNPFSPFANDTLLHRYVDGIDPLSRSVATRNAHAGFTLGGDIGKWRWSATGNWDRNVSRTLTSNGVETAALQTALDAGDTSFNPFAPLAADRIVGRAFNQAESTSNLASLDAFFGGPLLNVPAGAIATSIRVSGRTSDFDSNSLRYDNPSFPTGQVQNTSTARDLGNAQVNLDLPIASRRRGVLAPIGDLSLNGNVEVEQLSDFGTLTTIGYGLNWSPITQVRFIVSVTDEEGAPSAQQLGNPILLTPNVRVFDYRTGESVDITRLDGGNPGLSADNRHALKLGLNVRPLKETDLTFTADYNRATIRNPISSFPTATAELEEAFPTRFLRDGEGRLLQIDNRPVNFERSDHEELRWGINFSMPIKSNAQQRIDAMRAVRQAEREAAERNGTPLPERPQRAQGGQGPGAGGPGGPGGSGGGRGFGGPGGPGGPGGGRGFGGGDQSGRAQFSLYHTWVLRDQIVIGPGLPTLDLLNGSATGSRGGQSAHQIDANGGYSRDGFGFRVNANWKSGTEVRGGTGGVGDLFFDDFTTVNLRLFANLGQQIDLVRKHRWLAGTRVTLAVDNVFDSRLQVTDAAGATPLSYQPGSLDPLGRTVKLSIRKLFF
jgi:hypothetical protein